MHHGQQRPTILLVLLLLVKVLLLSTSWQTTWDIMAKPNVRDNREEGWQVQPAHTQQLAQRKDEC